MPMPAPSIPASTARRDVSAENMGSLLLICGTALRTAASGAAAPPAGPHACGVNPVAEANKIEIDMYV